MSEKWSSGFGKAGGASILYGARDDWSGQPFAELDKELVGLVQGGQGSTIRRCLRSTSRPERFTRTLRSPLHVARANHSDQGILVMVAQEAYRFNHPYARYSRYNSSAQAGTLPPRQTPF